MGDFMNNGMISVPALAYLGDSVFELAVRCYLVKSGITKSSELNKKSLEYVTAAAQCKAVEKILPRLSEEEAAMYHRGRNHRIENHPKSVSACQYKQATGLEVLFAWLYLEGKQQRIDELFDIAFNNTFNNK